MLPKGLEVVPESNVMDIGSVYVRMSLIDIVLFNKDHFAAIRDALEQNIELTHIVSEIVFTSACIDKQKVCKDKNLKNFIVDPYVMVVVVSKIDRDQDGFDLMTSNILLQIYEFLKLYIKIH